METISCHSKQSSYLIEKKKNKNNIIHYCEIWQESASCFRGDVV